VKDDLADANGDDPLGPIAESFLFHVGQGERPAPSDYAVQHPEHADQIHDLFPVIAALEQIAEEDWLAADAPDPLEARHFPAPFGRYDLLRKLGRGGMGVVYQAWDRDAQRVVALKIIRPDVLEDARFRFEAGVLARLEHENVIPLYEVGEHEGIPYYTMRFVEGGDLNGHLAEYAVPPTATGVEAEEALRRAAGLMAKVARAVEYVHRRGVLHRDLKPGNILIGGDGRPLVSDFGLAHRFGADALAMTLSKALSEDPESWSGRVVGTLGYMAPEQAAGSGDLTTAADLFSLGAILYRLLAGTLPFGTDSLAGLVALLDPDRAAPRPSGRNPAVPKGCDLEWICLICLAKDPAERYKTADELADHLERGARGEALPRPDRGWPGQVLKAMRRRRPCSDNRSWSRVDQIDAVLGLALHAGLFGLMQAGASAPTCWGWFLAFEAAAWWIFITRLFRGRRTEHSERDLLVLWVGMSLASLVLFALYCPPFGTTGASALTAFYPPWSVVTGLGFFLAGRIHWGNMYVVGLAFLGLAVVMPLAPAFAPLMYGLVYALGLGWMGREHARWALGAPAIRH
jgi:serine/threonine protein kinase